MDTQHDRHGRAIDIAIEQPYGSAFQGKRCSKIHGHRGLPHAALTAADRDDVLHALQRGLVHRRRCPHFRRHINVNLLHAGESLHQRNRLVPHLIFDRASRRSEIHVKSNIAAIDLEVADKAQRNDVLVQIRVFYPLKNIQNLLFGDAAILVFVPNSHDSPVSEK